MNVLFLGPPSPLLSWLRAVETHVWDQQERPGFARETLEQWVRRHAIDCLVSYGYKHLLHGPLVSEYRGRLVNCHISYLPWNRGMHPNPWAWYEGTPHGVSIHEIDAGVDTGPLLAQRRVLFGQGETLRTSYELLHAEMYHLFRSTWSHIRTGRLEGTPQPPGGTLHRAADLARLAPLLTAGWDTPVAVLEEAGRRERGE